METFNPKEFIEKEIEKMRQNIGEEKALVAVSGGVDSTTCAVLTHKAVDENLVCVILDDAFMREGEPEHVAEILSKAPFNVPTKIVNVREQFLQAMEGLRDAEEKRKAFRETFYKALSETAKREKCKVLVQGTIRADIIETVGGVKTQHNVLEQMGVNTMKSYGFKIVEPLVTLYKEQVRMVARHLGLPNEFSERQPFPGPGLSVRVVGEIRNDKLEIVRKATSVVERSLAQHKPSQYLAVVVDNEEAVDSLGAVHIQETVSRFLNVPSRNVSVKIFRDKATGVEAGKRRYGDVVGLNVRTMSGEIHQVPIHNLVSLQSKMNAEKPSITRVFYAIKELSEKKPYVVGVRSVETRDFLTAKVSDLPWTLLEKVAEEIIAICANVSAVYYDVTPKPPATIEME